MMTAYIITVRPGSPDRYTDSFWIDLGNAQRRAKELIEEFQRRGRPCPKPLEPTTVDWGAWITSVRIQDAVLGDPKEKDVKP